MSTKGITWFRMQTRHEANAIPVSDRSEPSLSEVLVLSAAVFAIHLVTVCTVTDLWELAATWVNNDSYLDMSWMIQHWSRSVPWKQRHFWGFPYAIAGLSKLFSVPELMALVLISVLASLGVSISVIEGTGGLPGGSRLLSAAGIRAASASRESHRIPPASIPPRMVPASVPPGTLKFCSYPE